MNYCPNCGAEVDATATDCFACGAALSAEFPPSEAGRTDQSEQPPRRGQQPKRQSDSQRPPHGQSSPQNRRAPREQQPPQEPTTNERHPPDSPQPRPAERRATRQPSADQNSSEINRRTLLLSGGGLAALAGGWFVFLRGDGGGGAVGGSTPPLDQLQVQLSDVRRPSVGATSATLPFILAFYNPTDQTIPDLSGDFDIYVNGTRVGSDELTVNRLEPDEETMVDLEVIVQYTDVSQALIDALRSQSFEVRIEGSVNAGGTSRAISVEGQI